MPASRLFRVSIAGLLAVALLVPTTPLGRGLPKPKFDKEGRLTRPVGYRQWVYVGTPLTPNDLNPPEASFPEFHNVYIHPKDYAAYKKTGTFPDGTVLVKELVSVGSKQAVSGAGYFMGEFVGLEATVKDSKRFANEPGNWAYFSYGHKYPLAESAAPFPTAACNTCHAVSAKDDFVFTQFYPVLRADRQKSSRGRAKFNRQGDLIRPTGYREWVYVGTPITPNDLNPPEAAFPDFHNVYIHPDDFKHYQQKGEFRDGTILVKELVSVGAKAATSGVGYFQGEFTGLEATIKDSKRYPDEPGNWAYYTFGHSYPLAESAKAGATAACNACHEPNAADDWVFTQYYPVLRAAKGMKGKDQGGKGTAMTASNKQFQTMESTMTNAMGPAFQPTAETPAVESLVPTDKAALLRFLKGGEYKNFAAKESANHPSRGPHSQLGWPVRVFMGSKIDASMKAGNKEHPMGSSIVKEMYTDNGKLQGWAVMVKTAAESNRGQGWFWYETLNMDDSDDVVASGNGVPLCFGCHSIGKDFVLTTYPFQ